MTTPFAPSGWSGFEGADPGLPQYWDVGPHRVWLGDPTTTNGMIELPAIGVDGYAGVESLGETVHGLMSGGLAVTTLDSQTRQWTLTWPNLAGRDYQVLQAFYRGLFAAGDLIYVPPEDANRLTLAQSLCGNLNGVAEGWTPTAGTVAYDSTVAPTTYPSGVLRWTGAGNGSRLVAGNAVAGVATADPNYTAPYLPAMPAFGYVWAATASGTASARVRLSGIAADGSTIVSTVNGSTVTLTTTPQQVAVSIAANALTTAAWLFLDLQSLTASAPNILISNPLLDYRSAAPTWALGSGVPRVQSIASPGGTIGRHMTRDGWTLSLSESVPGAA